MLFNCFGVIITCLTCFTSTFAMDAETKEALDQVLVNTKKSPPEDVIQMLKNAKNNNDPNNIGRCPKSAPCFKGSFNGTSTSPKESPLLTLDQPLVFISSTMPKESLMALVNASKSHKIRLVIRGMVDGSMIKTAKFSKELGHPIDIDPKLFRTFNIKSVPVFMVKANNTVYTLSGNVTLDWALQKLKTASQKGAVHD